MKQNNGVVSENLETSFPLWPEHMKREQKEGLMGGKRSQERRRVLESMLWQTI